MLGDGVLLPVWAEVAERGSTINSSPELDTFPPPRTDRVDEGGDRADDSDRDTNDEARDSGEEDDMANAMASGGWPLRESPSWGGGTGELTLDGIRPQRGHPSPSHHIAEAVHSCGRGER